MSFLTTLGVAPLCLGCPATLKPLSVSQATLASMSFYNLYSFGRNGYKNDVKKNVNTCIYLYMQASDCVINYLNKNNFFVALSTICDTFLHINK